MNKKYFYILSVLVVFIIIVLFGECFIGIKETSEISKKSRKNIPFVKEYKLLPVSSNEPYGKKVDAMFDRRHKKIKEYYAYIDPAVRYNSALKKFNYKLVSTKFHHSNINPAYDLIRNNKIILTIGDIECFNINKSKTKFFFYARQRYGSEILFENGNITKWDSYRHGYQCPFYLGDKKYYLNLTEKISIFKNVYQVMEENKLLFTFSSKGIVKNDVDAFYPSPDGKSWIVEFNNNVVVNSRYIGKRSFLFWHTPVFNYIFLNKKPFYFFQKSRNIYMSYNNITLSKCYDEVLHYLCCEPGAFNPAYTDMYLGFFAKRNNYWYYVEVYFNI